MGFLAENSLAFMLAQVWRYAEGRRVYLALDYILLTIAYTVMSLQPLVVAQIVNAAQKGGPDAFRNVMIWSGVYASSILGFWLFNGPARIIERRLAFHISHNYFMKLYRIVTEMPLCWHRDHHSGDVNSRVGKAGGALSGFAAGQFIYFQMGVRFAVGCIALAYYSPWVAVASVVSSAAIFATIRRFDLAIVPLVQKGNEAEHYLGAALNDYMGNIVTVLALRLQESTLAEISRRFMRIKPIAWPEINISESKWTTVAFLLVGTQAAITGGYIGAKLWHHEALMMGAAVAIFQYLLVVNQIFYQVMQTFDGLMRQHTDMHSIDELLEDHAKLGAAAVTAPMRSWRAIRIENLDFTHHEGEDALHHLRGINLDIHAGQKIALIGASGSGKTTLLTLLRGLHDAREVKLGIDEDVFQSLAPLSGFTSVVPQDCEIFDNTVRYNLTLGTDAVEKTVQQALAISTFDDVLPKLPDGIDTDIRERGVNLSGGQKQRLALARGLIAARKSSLLLLDEPTSQVDIQTESVIFDRLLKAFSGTAIIAAVHRLHLVPRFDHICLMRDGAIVEQGGFNELLAQGGAFAQLWTYHMQQSLVDEDEKTESEVVNATMRRVLVISAIAAPPGLICRCQPAFCSREPISAARKHLRLSPAGRAKSAVCPENAR